MVFVDLATGSVFRGELRGKKDQERRQSSHLIHLTGPDEELDLEPYEDEDRYRILSATLDEVSRMDRAGYCFRRMLGGLLS